MSPEGDRGERAPVMELRGLRKAFGPVQALKSVDLVFRPGEIHAIVGENGAGKSTMIGVAAGVLAADAGSIVVDGREIAAPTPGIVREAGVSVTWQHPALATDLTVLENLQLVAPSLTGPDGPAQAAAILRRIATDQLLMPLGQRVAELTLAQRHIVEIARALATQPRILFFDEPTEPFQEADIRKLFGLITALRADGVAIVYVSHRLHEIDELADRISVMRDGEVIESRPADTITTAEIVTLIAGRPLEQIFPGKARVVGPPVLEISGLRGPGFGPVDLIAHAGEIVGLAGVEGEGQREFLRTMAGVDRRHGGTIKINGAIISGAHPAALRRAGVGFLSDDRHAEGLFLSLSLRENLGIRILDTIAPFGIVNRAAELAVASTIVEELRVVTASVEAQVSSMSGGNQQKVLIGREMTAKPAALLIDEPTKGVDIGSRAEIYRRLRALAETGMTVVVVASDGIELEGLCDRVAIFARGSMVRELRGADVTDTSITEANLTATASRTGTETRQRTAAPWRTLLAGDHFPAAVLAVLTAIILGGTQFFSPFFLTGLNVEGMLTFLAILTFVSIGQLTTVLVGGIDLSIGALAGLMVVLASFVMPDGASNLQNLGAGALLLLFAAGFGLFQGWLVTEFRLPAVIVTLASFIGLQGLSLTLRPRAGGNISDSLSDLFQFPVSIVPAGMILALIVVAGGEWLLYRGAIGRRMRAVGSSPVASQRLGLNSNRHTVLAFVLSGTITGVAGLMLAGQVGIGSATTGADYTLMSLTAVVLGGANIAGGRGSLFSTLLGAALVQAISSASAFINSDSSWHYTVLGIVTLLAAIFFSVARWRPFGGAV